MPWKLNRDCARRKAGFRSANKFDSFAAERWPKDPCSLRGSSLANTVEAPHLHPINECIGSQTEAWKSAKVSRLPFVNNKIDDGT
jgi:hypothetical protein